METQILHPSFRYNSHSKPLTNAIPFDSLHKLGADLGLNINLMADVRHA